MKKWEPLHLVLDNSKSEGGQSNYPGKIKNVQGQESSSYQI